MSKIDIPGTHKEFWKVFQKISYRWDYSIVFDDILTIFMTQFVPKPHMENWHAEAIKKYDEKERSYMGTLQLEYLKAHLKATEEKKWFDFWGILYECIVSRMKSSRMGQFFTPPDLCDLLTAFTLGGNNFENKNVNDPACGSGRNLLSGWSVRPKNYYLGEDIDLVCCKMAAINLCIHGVKGEIVQHDTLKDPGSFINAWAINSDPYYSSLKLPHIVPIDKPENSIICNHWLSKLDQEEPKTIDETPIQGQLSIF